MFDETTLSERHDGDDQILAKFREWCTARRAAERLDDDDWEIAEAYLDREVEELFAMPVAGPAGFAVKLFFLLREDDKFGGQKTDADPCILVPVEPLGTKLHKDRMIVALARDMVRVVPELAPLCTAVLESEEEDGHAEDEEKADDPAAPPAAGADADLLAAEREIAALRAQSDAFRAAGDGGDHNELWDRIWSLETQIAVTPPVSLIGAAVKLRRLADPNLGIEAGPTEEAPDSIRQVLALIEREAQP